MKNFNIGDSVLFKKIKDGKWCGYEKEPFKIINTFEEQKQTMFYIKNKLNEFWTTATALILDMNFISTNDFTNNQVFIKYADGRKETISESEYSNRYAVKQVLKPKAIYEQLTIFDI